MKTFRLLVTGYKTLIVKGVKDIDEALALAGNECSSSDFEIDLIRIEEELLTEKDIKRVKKFGADTIEAD